MMASNFCRPGDLCDVEGSPPLRCSTTSVVRFSAPTLLTPATYLPSHFTRNLKFLYGSKRCALTLKEAITLSSGSYLAGHLLDADNNKLGRLERREADQHIHHAAIDVVLGRDLL